jgi:hypothetical protein
MVKITKLPPGEVIGARDLQNGAIGAALVVRACSATGPRFEFSTVRAAVSIKNARYRQDSERCFVVRNVDPKRLAGGK